MQFPLLSLSRLKRKLCTHSAIYAISVGWIVLDRVVFLLPKSVYRSSTVPGNLPGTFLEQVEAEPTKTEEECTAGTGRMPS